MSRNRDRKNIRVVINDGGDWPELPSGDVQIDADESCKRRSKTGNARRLTVIFGALFLLYTLYAMMLGDAEMLRSGFDFVKLALAASIAWTFGRGGTPIS